MPTYGITPAGFVPKPYTQILLDLQSAWLANVDPTADLSATTPEGQILAILANMDAEKWELGQAAWNAYNREDAEGAALDNIGDLSGNPRDGPSYTQVACNLTLASGTYAPGSLVAYVTGNPSLTFSNLSSITIPGTSTGILFQAQTIGPTGTINPGTLCNISTPVTGWSAITNPTYQTQLGADEETDDAYAIRQQQQIGAEGSCTPPSMVSELYELFATTYGNAGQEGPYSASFYNNTTLAPINFGTIASPFIVPPKSFGVVVYDPYNLVPASGPATALPNSGQGSFAATIWQNCPAGIESFGTSYGTILDPYLGSQTMFWSVPTPIPLYISATVAIYPNQVWSGIAAAIQQTLVNAAIAPTQAGQLPPIGQLTPGASIIGSQLQAVILSVPGTYAVQALTFGFTASPVNTADMTPLTTPPGPSPLQVATISGATVSTNVLLTQGTYP
jgi:uncharacterized phage protein gp47/JayE